MTNAIDKAIGPVAAKMIAKFGTEIVLKGGEVSKYDATTGVISKDSQEATIKAIIGSATSISGSGVKSNARGTKPNAVSNSLDKSSFVLTIAANGLEFAPETGYTVDLRSKTFSVQSVSPTFSGDDIATYGLVVSL